MIPDNITKEHLEKAIKEIDQKGVRKGRHLSTYDLDYNGKLYPPKLVISIANRYANEVELDPNTFEGGKGTPAFRLLSKEGFEVVPKNDPVIKLIEDYKKRISETHLKDEEYKWKLLKEYRGRPNIEAKDFYQEIKDSNFDNLVYAMSKAVLNGLAKSKPEELRGFFKELFNENIDLTERVNSFNKKTLKLYNQIEGKHSHHQDERSIATYLTFHNPEKYTFYKSSFYTEFCKMVGAKKAKKNEKYTHYLTLINELIENYIESDNDLISQVKEYLPEYYDGTNHHLLAQDILYQMFDQKEELSYWIFQGNPKLFDFKTALQNEVLDDWTVSAHKDKIKPGDKVILWITGDKAGCYALAEVTSKPHAKQKSSDDHLWKVEDKSELKTDIKITHNLAETPILKKKIDKIEELKGLKVGNQGTNFASTETEYNYLLKLASNMNGRKFWLYKPGKQAVKWDEFYGKGIMAIAWDDLDDLSRFNDKSEIEKILLEGIPAGKRKYNDARACFEFAKVVQVGDVVIANKGKREYIGWGIVKSDYIFDPTVKEYTSIRKVEWKDKGLWHEEEADIVTKTLTDITKYPDYVERLVALMGIEQEATVQNRDYPLNTILYGPPGTGKTYQTVKRAAEIISERQIDDYGEALELFTNNLHDQIEFITFHQNYSYEDFIQGLRPDVEQEGTLSFERSDGVFKKIADKALENLKLSDKAPEEVSREALFDEAIERLSELVQDSQDYIPINESTYIMDVDDSAFRYSGANWVRHQAGIRMKFSDLKEFYLNNISDRKQIKSLLNISQLAKQHATYYLLVYKMVLKYLPKKMSIQNVVLKKNYVIVIDEINRANISRVFGELITLIEPDKRSHGAIPLQAKLPSGDTFIVPSNLYIIGTMNTADKSIALLDIALRRRFEFEAMYPKYEIDGTEVYDAEILRKINKEIIDGKGHDFQIGHAYFMGDNKDLIKRMNKKVIPLLLEYYMNDEKEVTRILGKAGLMVKDGAWPLEIVAE
ncbi:MAG TPA: hypothetical protein DCR04_06870 [Flavobacteriales bacterium]|nr:hypothetical protein [Flavobacteriales bacterium]